MGAPDAKRITLDDILAYRRQIEAALAHGNGCYAFSDIVGLILAGRFQMWAKGESLVLTEVADYPQKRVAVAFLAAGRQDELAAMTPALEEWAKASGCTEAWITGRKGWAKSYLTKSGWSLNEKVTLSKSLRSE